MAGIVYNLLNCSGSLLTRLTETSKSRDIESIVLVYGLFYPNANADKRSVFKNSQVFLEEVGWPPQSERRCAAVARTTSTTQARKTSTVGH